MPKKPIRRVPGIVPKPKPREIPIRPPRAADELPPAFDFLQRTEPERKLVYVQPERMVTEGSPENWMNSDRIHFVEHRGLWFNSTGQLRFNQEVLEVEIDLNWPASDPQINKAVKHPRHNDPVLFIRNMMTTKPAVSTVSKKTKK